jgi:hypothetical protein
VGIVSEYQYYDFRALDRPLTPRQQSALRALSSRAEITSTSFTNSYDFGDFRGKPLELVQRYFDAFLYLAHWGTRELMFRIPAKDAPTAGVLRCYLSTSTNTAAWFRRSGANVVFGFCSEEEGGDWETDGEGELASIVPVRFAIGAGDLRPLYLGWLLRVQAGDIAPDTPEPDVPAGLNRPSAGLTAMIEFLRIDRELLAAAKASGRRTTRRRRTVKELLASAE